MVLSAVYEARGAGEEASILERIPERIIPSTKENSCWVRVKKSGEINAIAIAAVQIRESLNPYILVRAHLLLSDEAGVAREEARVQRE